MSIEANIVRIAINNGGQLEPTNKLTGDVVALQRSRDIAIQLGYYERGVFVPNPSHLATITVELRTYTNKSAAATITAATSTIAQISEGEWENDTNQHATILLPAAQTAGIASADSTDYWLVITALTTGGKPLTLAAGRCVGRDDFGNYSATVPTPGDPTYVTAVQFYSAINAIQTGEIVENGWRARIGVDINGVMTWNVTPA